jgi:hypothetical protein
MNGTGEIATARGIRSFENVMIPLIPLIRPIPPPPPSKGFPGRLNSAAMVR